ncbi:FUSC family protein [Bradyrhizobium sp. CIAT3101]|uniref:FUSC family protein n=1 Tax=Bradyrhizobium sp. CIAT3101 TaxID=439387 RepID=UPI0024B21832|nr:FUSC family protein [Bradyrhizobium sp. CIAT3101]WFU82440.1 FUSC family protein [Bradyrhizobium sp. CIAT3101]
MVATTSEQPLTVANIPLSSWSFAIRVWLAMLLALLVSFWLQLEAPASAAVTVGILAEPTRGQALEKAGFRLLGTIVGVAASIAVTELFSQERDLILAAFAVWIGICVFAANLLDGYRAYAAVLSGYTVALIATQQIDTPQHVFESGLARGAAISVGILSMAVVNTFMYTPDRHPRLLVQLTAIRRRVREYASAAFRGEQGSSTTFLALLREIVALRPEIASVALETSSGSVRSIAARSAAVGLVAELQTARILNVGPVEADNIACNQARPAFVRAGDSGLPVQRLLELVAGQRPVRDVETEASAWAARQLLLRDEEVRQDLLALRSARWPLRAWRAPLYRSYRTAAESGVRAAIWFAIAATFYIWAGWPAASVSLSFVALIIGLGATTPSPRGFTTITLIGTPIAAVLTGILEFIILNGADAFPVLAVAMAPFTIGAAALMRSQSLLWSSLGRVNLLFVPVLLAPSNPQTYNPQSFLFTSLFLVAAAALLLAAQTLIPPVSDDERSKRLLLEARSELQEPAHQTNEASEEATFRDASRIGQFLSVGGAQDGRALAEMLSCFDQSVMVRLCEEKLKSLADEPLASLADEARLAIVNRDTAILRTIAHRLRDGATQKTSIEADLAACLILTSRILDRGSGIDFSQEVI